MDTDMGEDYEQRDQRSSFYDRRDKSRSHRRPRRLQTQIQNGQIIPTAYAIGISRTGRTYRLGHQNPSALFFVPIKPELKSYFEEAEKTIHSHCFVCVPCVVGKRINKGRYKARVLMPPGIDEEHPLFLSGLVVPEVSIDYPIRRWNSGSPIGYILESPHLSGSQRLYAPPRNIPDDLPEDTRYQAIVWDIFGDGERKPRVQVFQNRNSHETPEIFEQNTDALAAIQTLSDRMWW